jgi:hypothetical protein
LVVGSWRDEADGGEEGEGEGEGIMSDKDILRPIKGRKKNYESG